MSKSLHEKAGFTPTVIMLFVLLSYLIYSVTKVGYNNYKVDQYILQFEAHNEALKAENLKKTEDYLYFTSSEYRDKIAKQNWNYINPGEKVIVLTNNSQSGSVLEEPVVAEGQDQSNFDKWVDLFFG